MKNNSQILSISIMIIGIIIAIIGYGMFANLICYCPMQTVGQPSICHCGEPEITFGHILIYMGIVITLGGITTFLVQLKKTISKI
jgi:hypothetical protein